MLKFVITVILFFYCVTCIVFAAPTLDNNLTNDVNNEIVSEVSQDMSVTEDKNPTLSMSTTILPPVVVLLTQGACDEISRGPRIYTENFLLENDGKSQVEASMLIEVSGTPNITCIEIVSRSDDKTRPSIISGGVGHSFVNVGVVTEYGKGFNFSVNLFGSYFTKQST